MVINIWLFLKKIFFKGYFLFKIFFKWLWLWLVFIINWSLKTLYFQITNPFIEAYNDLIAWFVFKKNRIIYLKTNYKEAFGTISWIVTLKRAYLYAYKRSTKVTIWWWIKFLLESIFLYHYYILLYIYDLIITICRGVLNVILKFSVITFQYFFKWISINKLNKKIKLLLGESYLFFYKYCTRFYSNIQLPYERSMAFIKGTDELAAVFVVLLASFYAFIVLLAPYADELFYKGRKLPYFMFYYLIFVWPTYYWCWMFWWFTLVSFTSLRYSYMVGEVSNYQLIITCISMAFGLSIITAVYVWIYWVYFHIYWERRTDKIEFQILLERGKNFFIRGTTALVYKEVAATPEPAPEPPSLLYRITKYSIYGLGILVAIAISIVIFVPGDTDIFTLPGEFCDFVSNEVIQFYQERTPWGLVGVELAEYRLELLKYMFKLSAENRLKFVRTNIWVLVETELAILAQENVIQNYRLNLQVIYASLQLDPLVIYDLASLLHHKYEYYGQLSFYDLDIYFHKKHLLFSQFHDAGCINIHKKIVDIKNADEVEDRIRDVWKKVQLQIYE